MGSKRLDGQVTEDRTSPHVGHPWSWSGLKDFTPRVPRYLQRMVSAVTTADDGVTHP